MKRSDLVFVGIRGSVIAVSRATGQQVWATHLKGSDFVNVVVENGAVLATTYGELFCLDAASGTAVWHNELKGFGRGFATMATCLSSTNANVPSMSEKRRRDEQDGAAAAMA